MGYELKQLMKMYGVSTPTMAPAPQMPGAAPTAVAELVKPELRAQPVAPVKPGRKASAEEKAAYQAARSTYNADLKTWNADKKTYDAAMKTYNTALPKYQEDLAKYEKDKAAFDETMRKYGLDKAQYDQYAQEYQNRLANTNIYNQAQFSTTGANVPPIMTYSDEQVAPPPTGTQYGTPQWSDVLKPPVYAPLTAMNVMPPTSVVPPVDTMSQTPTISNQGGGGRDRDGMGGMGNVSRPGNGTGTGSFGLPDPFGGGSRTTFGGYTGLRDMFDGGGPGQSGQRGGYTGLRDMFDGGGPGRSRPKAEGGYIQNYAQGGTVRGYAPGGAIYGGAGDDVLMGGSEEDTLPPAPVAEDPLMAMYERYALKPVDYSAQIAAATERRAAEQKAFEELLMGRLDAKDNAPQSKAEMYFRLAAAFGAPTKTGHFSENLALVGQTMADELAAKAEREREARAAKLGVQTELQKMRMEAAGEELDTYRGLQESETKYGRELSRDLIKDYIASGKPQSEAGRIAMDMGLKPGTPEFNDEVKKQTELKIQRELAAIQAQIASTASTTAAAGRMSSTEINLRTETENNLANLNQALSDVAEAYRLNPNSYSGSLTDMAVRKLQETVGSDDPMIVNTRRIENLLGQQALGTLKTVFGGNPTEGERAILLELQGIGAKSLEERSEIMLRLYEVLQERQARETKRLDDILSGAYRSYTPIDGGE